MRKGQRGTLAILVTALLAAGNVALAAAPRAQTVTIVTLNVFHGIDCVPVRGEQCRVADRIALLFERLAALGCPDIVTLQEVLDRTSVDTLTPDGQLITLTGLTSVLALIQTTLTPFAQVCGFEYRLLSATDLVTPPLAPVFQGTDEELILSRYPIVQEDIRLLHSALYVPTNPALRFFARHVLFARIQHPVGLIDVFTTHLAASEDFGDNPCHSQVSFPLLGGVTFDVPCPAECDPSQTVRECEARQVANFVKELHGVSTPAFITGDFNAQPHSAVYKEISRAEHTREHRWIDSYLAADNPECNRHTGIGCTAGRDASGGDLENPALNVDERIDYIFVVPSAPESACTIQEKGTGLFADEPNLPCGPFPLPICWASDHNGTRANLSCTPEAEDHEEVAQR
jgi:endonuclease/exonuclease/phosphatase family metal-dependent hydrolase